ncbi:hypothetical protein M0804_007441 [Polistes exclamans]|nr:hypothetical protein M0804_007441 [Polistes exclamans]
MVGMVGPSVRYKEAKERAGGTVADAATGGDEQNGIWMQRATTPLVRTRTIPTFKGRRIGYRFYQATGNTDIIREMGFGSGNRTAPHRSVPHHVAPDSSSHHTTSVPQTGATGNVHLL